MATVISLRTEVVHQYVYEIRFDFGQVYWDRAGRIAKEILSRHDDWSFESIDLNACRLSKRETNLVFNFGHSRLDLSQSQTADVAALIPVGEFGAVAEELTNAVVRHLELDAFPRIGFRAWYLYPASDRKQSQDMLRDLRLFTLDGDLSNSLGEISEASYRVVVERARHTLRIAVSPFEQRVELPEGLIRAAKARARDHSRGQRQVVVDQLKAKKKIAHYPQFGVLVDLDASIDDPPYPADLLVSDFINGAVEDFARVKEAVLKKR